MNLMALMATLSLDTSEYEKGLQDSEGKATSAGSKIGGALSTLGKVVAAASAAAAAAVSKLTYDAVNSYANYEQLIGGVETLFKDSADIVSEYADNAYKTAGLSANEYMETVTSFSASLLQSLGGDTEKAAEYADLAITDMSDNANKMGTNMSSIQMAYQGFAKQNYTMLDNLKLGYGGTKTEMERLITDAELLDSSFKATRDSNGDLAMSYADIVDAIHIVQTNMGITGTTAKEAATTIEGSVNSMKASWKNLVTGLGNSNADITQLVDNFSSSLETAANNILPVVETAFNNMATALPQLVSNLLPKLTSTITNMLPSLLNAVTDLVSSIASQLPTMVKGIVDVLPDVIQQVFSNIGTIAGTLLPALAESLVSVLANLPAMLAGMVGGLVDGLSNFVNGIMESVAKQAETSIPENLYDGYVGKIQTNIEKTFSDGWVNLQGTIAKILGDAEWSDAVEGIKLASALQDKIISDYNSAKDAMSKYSFENFQVETEAHINTAMTLLGALEGMLDENGVVTGNLGVVQSYIDQVNGILGEGAVTLDETPADWMIKIADKYKDSDGNVTDPAALRQEITKELNSLLTGDSINLNEQTYNAVSKVLNGYTEADALADSENIKREIEAALIAAGVPEVDAKAIANASVEEGAIKTWYGTSTSSSWDNSQFINWMQANGHLPQNGETIPIDDIAVICSAYITGDIDSTEFNEQLEALNLPEDVKNQTIQYVVNTEQVNDAIEAFKELTKQKYLSSLTDVFSEATIQNTMDFSDAIEGANNAVNKMIDSNGNLKESIPKDQFKVLNENLNDATLAMNAHREEAEQMWSTYYDLAGGAEEFGDKETFVQQQLANDGIYQQHKETIAQLRQEQSEFAAQLVETADGYKNLSAADKEVVKDIAYSADTFENFGNTLGLTTEQTNSLATAVTGYMQQFGAGTMEAHLAILQWAESSAEAKEIADSLGMSTYELGQMLYGLAENEDLLVDSSDNASSAVESLGESVDGVSDTISDEVPQVEAAVEELEQAAIPEVDKTAINAEGQSVTSEFNDGISSGAGDVTDTVQGIVDDINSTVSPLPGDMQAAGSDSGSNLESSFSSWQSAVSGSVDTMYNFFYTVLGTMLPPLMSTWGSYAGQKFNSGLNLWTGDIRSTATNIASSIQRALSGLPSQLYNVGYQAGSGIYNGLSSWSGTLSSLAWSIANSINAAARAALAIKSPSGVLRETFGYAGEGMYLGLHDWKDTVVDEAESIADGIAGALDSDYGYDGFGDLSESFNGTLVTNSGQNEQLYQLLQEYLPQLANMQIVIDKDKTIGVLMPKINRENALQSVLDERGVVYA